MKWFKSSFFPLPRDGLLGSRSGGNIDVPNFSSTAFEIYICGGNHPDVSPISALPSRTLLGPRYLPAAEPYPLSRQGEKVSRGRLEPADLDSHKGPSYRKARFQGSSGIGAVYRDKSLSRPCRAVKGPCNKLLACSASQYEHRRVCIGYLA